MSTSDKKFGAGVGVGVGVTGLCAAIALMSGVVVLPGDAEPAAAEPSVAIETLPPEGEAPAEDGAPTEDPSAAPEPSDGGGDEDQEEVEGDESTGDGEAPATPSPKEVTIGGEDGTTYLYARADFSPELEVWTVDQETDAVTYTRYNCVGSEESSGFGTIEEMDRPRGDYDHEILWQGRSPQLGATWEESDIGLTDSTLISSDVTGDHRASSQTGPVLEQYGDMCVDAGKTVAGFVL